MDYVLLLALVGLQTKHFIADYTLQWPAMIAGKCHLDRIGGYLHAGIHVVMTLPILLLCGLSLTLVFGLLVFEFVIHYATDYAKGRYDMARKLQVHTRQFWVVHGADQLIHQITYTVMLAIIMIARQSA